MKLATMKNFVSVREWAFGVHAFGKWGTLVVLIGTGWAWSFSKGPSKSQNKAVAFGLCAGPFTVGGVL
jgi:hypothetical protein